MSQNPATSHRRALAPPAVTRFQLRTATASDAVFAPPFVAPHRVSVRYAARRSVPVSYEASSALEHGHGASHSIHAPEHDSWPVAAPGGTAEPAWSEASANVGSDVAAIDASMLQLTDAAYASELELIEVVDARGPAVTPSEPYLERADTPRDPAFPLDAFIVPTGVDLPPAGYAAAQAARLADQLEELARQVRQHGLGAIGDAEHPAQLARVLGAIVAGYQARDS